MKDISIYGEMTNESMKVKLDFISMMCKSRPKVKFNIRTRLEKI